MSDLVITITDAGREEVINAVNTGTAPVLIASIGVGSGKYTPSPTQTALKTPIKTITTFGGEAVSPDVIHVSIQDKSTDAYQMNEFGLFTDKGTLFAVYSHVDSVILEKTAKSILLLSTDIALKTLDATDITFGDTQFVNPPATETVKGVVELATDVETQAGTDKERAITPSSLKSVTASEERAGLIKIGSQAEVTTGTSTTLAVTPKTLKTAGDGRYLQQSEYLSEIEESGAAAQSSARGSLGLGNAATKNVGVAGGNVMQVGAFGLGGGSSHKANAYNNVGEIYRINNTSENSPTTGVAGVVSLPCDGGPSTGYVAVSYAGNAWVGSSNIPANGVKWNRVYTTGYKPSAADVDAYSKAESDGRFAFKSITINGKPLSSNVNLTAGDVNAWNKTESDGRYLKLTGGTCTGQIIAPNFASTPDATPVGSGTYSEQLNSKAPFFQPNWQWPVTSGGVFVPIAKGKSTRKDKGWPTAISYGYLMPGEDMHAHPVIHALGDSGMENIWDFDTQTGGISSGKAGEFATHSWVNGVLNSRVDWDTFNREVGARPTLDYVNGNFVSRVQRGAQNSMTMDGGLVEAPAGCVLTGGNGNEGNQAGIALYRPLQIFRGGNWQTIEG
uniref:Phage tail fibre protein N-terminal domain-containing protein n=1 Tax=Serratia proteamaculans (strain 568) TaxID=399741 RepID=A8GLQ7_SERP5